MANFKFQWWHLILAGILVFIVLQPEFNPFIAAVYNLTDPATNESYTCNSTMECYTNVGIADLATGPPAMACVNGTCRFAECVNATTEKMSCPGGTSISVRKCVDGIWEPIPGAICPPTDCIRNSDCVFFSDEDCDSELEGIETTCINYKCTPPTIKRCSKASLFFNTYKIYIISGILILLGVGGFLIAAPRKIRLW